MGETRTASATPASSRGALKIADLTEYFSPHGGIKQYLVDKGRVLARAGHEHLIIAPGKRDESVVLWQHQGGVSRLASVAGPISPLDESYRLLLRPRRIRRLIEAFAPDVLEVHSLQLAALVTVTLPERWAPVRSLFWHTDFIDAYVSPGVRRVAGAGPANWLSEQLWAWVRFVARRSDLVLVTSREQQAKLDAHGVGKSQLAPFGFDRELFSPAKRDAAWRGQALGEHSGALLLLAVGRLAPEKRFDVILDAFFELTKRRKAVLVVLGEGPERSRLAARCRGRHDVQLRGFEPSRERVATAMASSDILVHAAPFETFGMTLAQALLCGLPLVLPAAGAAADFAGPGYAELYPAGDFGACARAIERLAARSSNELRGLARGRGEALPAADEQVTRIVEMQRALLAGAR